MKKSVIVMAGFLALALAGSAQAAGNTMFAVQNAAGTGGVDGLGGQFIATDIGDISANGSLTVGGKYAGGLSNVPKGPGNVAITGPAGVFHVASESNAGPNASFLAQHAANPSVVGGSTFSGSIAPNFSFYRINRYDASHPTTPGAYVLPLVDNMLGYFNFGSLNTAVDPNLGTSRKNVAGFLVRAEGTWTSLTDTPTYFSWTSTAVGGAQIERMRISSAGNVGIGTTGTPTSKLQVVGLQVSDAGPPVGLTSGAFYRTTAGVVMVVP